MIPFKVTAIIFLLVGLTIGICLSVLFQGCGHDAENVTNKPTLQPSAIQKQVQVNEQHYQQKIDSLSASSQQLEKQLATTRVSLEKAKKRNTELQRQVYELLDKPTAVTDTAEVLADCDSLKVKVEDLIASSNEKDSLQDVQTQNLQQQIKVKDSTIETQQADYQSLKSSFNQSLQEQQTLLDQNNAFKKEIKRHKLKSKLASIGLIILSGITVGSLIHH